MQSTTRAPYFVLFDVKLLKRCAFERVEHCLGAPLHWGPRANNHCYSPCRWHCAINQLYTKPHDAFLHMCVGIQWSKNSTEWWIESNIRSQKFSFGVAIATMQITSGDTTTEWLGYWHQISGNKATNWQLTPIVYMKSYTNVITNLLVIIHLQDTIARISKHTLVICVYRFHMDLGTRRYGDPRP